MINLVCIHLHILSIQAICDTLIKSDCTFNTCNQIVHRGHQLIVLRIGNAVYIIAQCTAVIILLYEFFIFFQTGNVSFAKENDTGVKLLRRRRIYCYIGPGTKRLHNLPQQSFEPKYRS